MYDLRDLIIFLTQINTAFRRQGGAEGVEERKVAGNLIYKKNSGLNELLKLANPSPPSSIYKQKIWLLAPGPGFGGGRVGTAGWGCSWVSKILGGSQLLGGWEWSLSKLSGNGPHLGAHWPGPRPALAGGREAALPHPCVSGNSF